MILTMPIPASSLTLDQINLASEAAFVTLLDGIYEHSPWVAQAVASARPFHTLAQLKWALSEAVRTASDEQQLALLHAHPELAGRAAQAGALTSESEGEQRRAGLQECSPEEFRRLTALNAAYRSRFGFPFIMATRGPRGAGLGRGEILAAFERRIESAVTAERAEALRQVNRIAELRLNDKFGQQPTLGNAIWDQHEALARFSDEGYAQTRQLTVTYMTPAHQACARQIADWMSAAGFDSVEIDEVGNVVGIYLGADDAPGQPPARPRLLTGSHYDTVRNGGRYDGRTGVLVPLACVRELARRGERLARGIELVAFAEEEGQRYNAVFLGSSALAGTFDPSWLDQRDADGVSMREALVAAGHHPERIPALKRNPADYLGFLEMHIEQGPVLYGLGLPLGIVTSINGSVRFRGLVRGVASHAGTTPMGQRQDAACAAAELLLYVERRAAADRDSVGTVGMLNVPNGSMNVIPARCEFSLDLRAPTDRQRDSLMDDVLNEVERIARARQVRIKLDETMRADAAPCDPALRARWEEAVQSLGIPAHLMPSGAGHDAMKIHDILPQAMLFVRGQNGGISHNPLEATTSDDLQMAAEAFMHILRLL